jgi:hypothetical protein
VLETMVEIGLVGAGIYCALGVIVAAALHVRGLRAIDPGVAGASVLFRILVTPGLVALWPVMLAKWRRARRGEAVAGDPERPWPPTQIRRAQRLLITLLAVALPIVVAIGIATRWTPATGSVPPGVEQTGRSETGE